MKTLSATETALEVKKLLRKEFPGVKFSVTSQHSSLRIRWTDGPSYNAVEEKTRMFAGAQLVQNGGDMIKGYAENSMYNGEETLFATNYVFCERTLSPSVKIHLDTYMKKHYAPSCSPVSLRHWQYEMEQSMSGEELRNLKHDDFSH